MRPVRSFDAIVVGGGPAGSTAAQALVAGGRRVAVLDAKAFPRVKLCAGWVSAPVWDVLELSPRQYPGGLWEWHRCHVRFRGESHTIRARGWFIRRYELDDFLLRRSGAEVIEGHHVKKVERADGAWVVDGALRAPVLVGAGGTHCPVARALFPRKPQPPVGVKERELPADAAELAACRAGGDGEPELLLHDDLSGYSWNVPKTDWLNVGSGTARAREVSAAWRRARDLFAPHLPPSAASALEGLEGWSYHLFEPAHLEACERDGAYLAGDALGLAQPFTAEGILPAVLSGRLAAEAIAAGGAGGYAARLRAHPLFRDYTLYARLRSLAGAIPGRGRRDRLDRLVGGRLGGAALARAFAWMFQGRPLPGGALLSLSLRRRTAC